MAPASGSAPACALLVASLVAAGALDGQTLPAFRAQADNDYFDFRLPPRQRPDVEYTHGVRLAAGVPRPLGWARLARGVAPCDQQPRRACGSTVWEIGQLMFTPTFDAPVPRPGQRPYAGWLYGSMTGRVERPGRLTAVSLLVGVTGPASLADRTQAAFHEWAGFRRPLGWSHQLRTELAGAARVEETRLLATVARGRARLFDATAAAGGAVGTWRTAASLAVRGRAGYGLTHPWRTWSAAPAPPRFGAYALWDAGGELVARDLTLDGSTFGPSPQVARRPVVGRWGWGVAVRAGRVGAEYRLATRGREYRTGPRRHSVGVFALEVQR